MSAPRPEGLTEEQIQALREAAANAGAALAKMMAAFAEAMGKVDWKAMGEQLAEAQRKIEGRDL